MARLVGLPSQLQRLLMALSEDVGPGDVTTRSVVPERAQARARFVSRAEGVVCGLPFLPWVFAAAGATKTFDQTLEAVGRLAEGERSDEITAVVDLLGSEFVSEVRLHAEVRVQPAVSDGDYVQAGAVLCELAGAARPILTGERLALNLLARLSGIATLTAQAVKEVEGTGVQLYDTRKTTPLWRDLEKYAVRKGGGHNHRWGLYDQVIIKDNHLAVLGGDVGRAVRRARRRFSGVIEVEVENLEDLRAAFEAGADVVLLDNMSPPLMRACVLWVDNHASPHYRPVLEASGGIKLANLRQVAQTGVDRISLGFLTHSAHALDIALDFEPLGRTPPGRG